jgi:hypothetical protein
MAVGRCEEPALCITGLLSKLAIHPSSHITQVLSLLLQLCCDAGEAGLLPLLLLLLLLLRSLLLLLLGGSLLLIS